MISRKSSWLRNRHTDEEKHNTAAYFEEDENICLLSHLLQRLKILRSLISPLFYFLLHFGNVCQLFFLIGLNVTQDLLLFLNHLCLHLFKQLLQLRSHCFCIGLNEQIRKWCTGSGTQHFSLVSLFIN